MEALNAAAAIGHPEAFMAKCRIGKDKKAPPALVTDGRIWCVVGMDVIPSLKAELDPAYVAEIMSTEALSSLLNDISKVKGRMCRVGADAAYPSEEEMRREYDRFKASAGDKEYKVAHILVVEKATAQQILERLARGERYEDLAKALSIDPGSAERGGDLDWSAPGNFVNEFAEAVLSTPVGTYSREPVHTPFGWHIVKVDAVRRAYIPGFQEIKESIRTQMRIKRAQQGR
jgi:parvulin-like peptidyl-prolyl isomerase